MVSCRRSSRIRGATPLKSHEYFDSSVPLGPVKEGDESLTPKAQTQTQSHVTSAAPQTPVTAGRIRPAQGEMHPSKVHQSTTQEPDSGLRLGFSDIKALGDDQPSGITQQTPSKISVTRSSFDFKVDRPGLLLGLEAQQMMNELHEEALRIKARLKAEAGNHNKSTSVNDPLDIRRAAKTRPKASRFSAAHTAAFRKMNSIAEHPSAIRAQLSRHTSLKTNLKRSLSKARLDDEENIIDDSSSPEKITRIQEKLDSNQYALPNKRARKHGTEDVSSATRFSSSCHQPKKPSIINSNPQLLSRKISTKKNNIKSPCRFDIPQKAIPQKSSASEADLTSKECLGHDKVNFSDKVYSPSKVNRIGSNVGCRGPGSETTIGPSALPMLSNRKPKCDLPLDQSTAPNTPIGIGRSKMTKHISFTPKTINKHAVAAQNSPSPIKPIISGSISKINFNTKSTSAGLGNEISNNRVIRPPSTDFQALECKVEYPRPSLVENSASSSAPGNFTFRSDQTIRFGSPSKSTDHMQATSGVHQLLKDGKSETMPASLLSVNKSKDNNIISVPHGMSNKRRKRPDSDDEKQIGSSSPKKLKRELPGATSLNFPNIRIVKHSPRKGVTPSKKPVVMTLSRLNFLAQPKNRRL